MPSEYISASRSGRVEGGRLRNITHETIVRYSSMRGACGMLFRWYLGSRGRRRVFGRWNDTLVRVLREE
jgi:hypothetical protein